MEWTFRCYCASDGKRDVIQDWYDSQSPETQAEFDNTLDFLRPRGRDEWKRPQFDVLHGECAGLGEIRFKANRVEHRIVGYFGPDRMKFAMLVAAIEKDKKFIPKSTCRTAQRRKTEVESNSTRDSHVCFARKFGPEIPKQTLS